MPAARVVLLFIYEEQEIEVQALMIHALIYIYMHVEIMGLLKNTILNVLKFIGKRCKMRYK
jgi:hypothetical protein